MARSFSVQVMVSSAIAGSATLACCIVTGIFSALFVSSNTNSLDQTRNYQIAADQVTIHEIQEDTDGFWAWVSSGRYSWVDTCVGIFVGFIISQWLLSRQKKARAQARGAEGVGSSIVIEELDPRTPTQATTFTVVKPVKARPIFDVRDAAPLSLRASQEAPSPRSSAGTITPVPPWPSPNPLESSVVPWVDPAVVDSSSRRGPLTRSARRALRNGSA